MATLIRRVYEESKALPAAGSAQAASQIARDRRQPRQPGVLPQEPDLLLHVARREGRLRRQAGRARPHGREGGRQGRRRGPWCWSTQPTPTNRASSSGAIPLSPAIAFPGGSSASLPATCRSPLPMAAEARPGARHHGPRQPAHQPGHRQPRLDAPLRRAPGIDSERLRHAQQPAHAPGTA